MTKTAPKQQIIATDNAASVPSIIELDIERRADDAQRKLAFIDAYRGEGVKNLGKTLEACKVSRREYEGWKELDPTFRDSVQEIEDALTDKVEAVLHEIAVDVTAPAAARIKAADTYLGGHRPDKYGKKGEGSGSGATHVHFHIGQKPENKVIDVKASKSD